MPKFKNQRGFTIIEIILVLAIIAVLSAITLAFLTSARQKSRDARRVSDIKQIQFALEFYYDVNKSYPVANSNCSTLDPRGLKSLVTQKFISEIPMDPSGSCYFYSTPASSPNVYHLGATLQRNDNQGLNSDKDCVDGGEPSCNFTPANSTGFSGTDPVYDVMP